jgi:hypothetical protein
VRRCPAIRWGLRLSVDNLYNHLKRLRCLCLRTWPNGDEGLIMKSSREWIGRPGAAQQLQELGQRVRALRLARGLSQNDLARPYSRAYMSLLEAGGISPSPRAIETLATRLGVHPEAFVSRGGPSEMSR